MGHAEQVGNVFDRRARQPALLLLCPHQHRYDRRGLAALGILADLGARPREVLGRELEPFRLIVGKSPSHGPPPTLNPARLGTSRHVRSCTRSTVDLPEHDIKGAEYRRDIGQEMS